MSCLNAEISSRSSAEEAISAVVVLIPAALVHGKSCTPPVVHLKMGEIPGGCGDEALETADDGTPSLQDVFSIFSLWTCPKNVTSQTSQAFASALMLQLKQLMWKPISAFCPCPLLPKAMGCATGLKLLLPLT